MDAVGAFDSIILTSPWYFIPPSGYPHALKTSNRPDRRYQPLFEAAMIKAMRYILQQNWKYYMVASELSDADQTIFSTAIAPHGIAIEQDSRLVDGTYLYNYKLDLVPLVESAIQE
ncbi:Cfr10I/Bse634I family restriction endonuclease [Coleofasciculus sp. E1-EBD-02]|uniref:Cfr10I/Bse634I family restriction endonuclease n=1 Tax=Coleofasciculus sp. E1-EBD-02 TaxID=3068481 RepID=UPI0032FB7A3A